MISRKNPFKYKQFKSEIILLCVRWYLRYGLTYRDLTEMMAERGLSMAHTTPMRWVHQYAPELDKRTRALVQIRRLNDRLFYEFQPNEVILT